MLASDEGMVLKHRKYIALSLWRTDGLKGFKVWQLFHCTCESYSGLVNGPRYHQTGLNYSRGQFLTTVVANVWTDIPSMLAIA